ncbi:origin recognition complex subunit 4 [Tilletia horrida]|nr:origin recognition complex subunit 4 [Tilletia horrida]
MALSTRSTKRKTRADEGASSSSPRGKAVASPSPSKRPRRSLKNEGEDADKDEQERDNDADAEAEADAQADEQEQETTADGNGAEGGGKAGVADPGIALETAERWLQRQKAACANVLAGGRPVLAMRAPELDAHRHRVVGRQSEYHFIRKTVAETLVHSASNSMAIVGATGTGKHTLLEAALDSVTEELLCDPGVVLSGLKGGKQQKRPFYHVRLDGVLQPTDRLCLRALARQLVEQGAFLESAVSSVIEDSAPAAGGGNADEEEDEEEALDDKQVERQRLDPIDLTLHEDEDDDEEEEEEDETDSGSESGDSDNVLGPGGQEAKARQRKKRKEKKDKSPAVSEQERQQINRTLLSSITNATNLIISLLSTPVGDEHSGPILSKPLVITLSHFEQVVNRDPQALLYCLFDAVQSSSYAPGLLVVGITTRIDVDHALEKRVKSRFSHRIAQIYTLPNIPDDVKRPPPPKKKTPKKGLTSTGAAEKKGKEEEEGEAQATVLDVVRHALLTRIPVKRGDGAEERAKWTELWTAEVENLLADKDFRAALRSIWISANSVKVLYRVLRPVIASLDASKTPILSSRAIRQSFAAQRMNAMEAVIRSLNANELTVLITARHIMDQGRNNFNFEMCWDEVRRWLSARGDEVHATSGSGGREKELELQAAAVQRRNAAEEAARERGRKRAEAAAEGRTLDDEEEEEEEDLPLGYAEGEDVQTTAAAQASGSSKYAFRNRGVNQVSQPGGSRAERVKSKNAFKSLLELELFIPDAALNSLNMTSLAGGLGGLSVSRKGSLLRDELVPVRCQVEKGDIIKIVERMVTSGEGGVGVDRQLLKWAKSSG